MLLKKCSRCGRLMPYGKTYCSECQPIVDAEVEAIKAKNLKKKQARYNRTRDAKYLTFYRSKDWKTLSKAYLQAKGYKCEACISKDCKDIACEVHHKEPVQTPGGWDRRLDWDNLEAVCTACHNARHPEKLEREEQEGVIDLRTVKT